MDLRESGFKGKVIMSGCVGTIAEATHGFGNSLRLPPRFPLSFKSSNPTAYPQVKTTFQQVIHRQNQRYCGEVCKRAVVGTRYCDVDKSLLTTVFISLSNNKAVVVEHQKTTRFTVSLVDSKTYPVEILWISWGTLWIDVDNSLLKDIHRLVENLGNNQKGVKAL